MRKNGSTASSLATVVLFSETCEESVRWKRLKTLRPSSSPTSLPPLLGEDDDLILDEDEKVAVLNEFFSRVAKTFDSSRFRQDHFEGVLEALTRNAAAFLPSTASEAGENGSICEEEVRACMQSLKLSKASGPDTIPAELIKHGGSGMCQSLTWMFNRSWDMGYLPLDWRTAHITPVPKESHARTPDRFHPISLLYVASKVMETVVKGRLESLAERGEWFSGFQGAYRKNRNSTDQLLYMSQRVHDEFERGKVGVVALIDVAKAYDCLWREGLLHTLLRRGVQGKMLAWIRAFLSDRRACVATRSARSPYLYHETGIPQGSVLSPIFFNIFMAGFFQVLSAAELSIFADDVRIMSFSDDPGTAVVNVNAQL